MATYAAKGDRFEDQTIRQASIKNEVGTSGDTRGLSPDLWAGCPIEQYKSNPEVGMYFFDDLIDGIDVAANQATAAVSALGTTGVFTGATDATAGTTISTLATNRKGAVVLASTTDNESAMIAWPKGAAVSGPVQFSSGKKVWMEARVQVNSIADSIAQLYVGFAEEALVAGGSLLLINEAGLADKDYLGFVREYADGDKLNTNFNTASGGASPVSNSNAATLEAATWTKIGIYSDGTTVKFYQDGVELSGAFLLSATDFPVDQEMAFYAECMCGAAGTDASMTIDWIAIAQEY